MTDEPRIMLTARHMECLGMDPHLQVIVIGRDGMLDPNGWSPEVIRRDELEMEQRYNFRWRFVIRPSLEHSYAISEDFSGQVLVIRL